MKPSVPEYDKSTLVSNFGSGATYDPNGNLTTGATWDRANRMRSFAGADYAYDGLGNRVAQTVSATVTRYLLDLQPGLAVVLSETAGAATTRYVHSPRGIHAQKDSANNWEWMAQDGLDSVTHLTHAARWKPCPHPYPLSRTPQTAGRGEQDDTLNLQVLLPEGEGLRMRADCVGDLVISL